MERVPQHDGAETVLEMLNRAEGFFAFRPADGADALLVSKAHTVPVSTDRQAPITDPARLSAAKLLGVELVLARGGPHRGWARVGVPPPHPPPPPFLNTSPAPPFSPLT